MKKLKFQIISAKDHFHHNTDWIDPSTYDPKPTVLEYCGWVTKETDEMVVLSQGRCATGSKKDEYDYDSHMHMLKTDIIRRKTIKIE